MQESVICREIYGSSSVKKKYVKLPNGKLRVINQSPKWTSLSQFFRSAFLPQGYPDSVSVDYLTYQIWDTTQAFASSITGTLATQAVLKGVGVGDESATILAATITWILKNGTGMVGRILFAWVQGTSLDCDAKRWRLFADILNDLAIFLEILAPSFPGVFTGIVCVAGVFKSIVGVAGGSTRAALTQHQARRNNMADVSAKDGSQETLVNLAALICSLALIPLVTGNEMLIWSLFLLFTALHLYANYKAVTSVVMETFNQARLHIVVKEYLTSFTIPSVANVNYKEPVIWKLRRPLDVKLGVSLDNLCLRSEDLLWVLKIYKNSNYLLGLDLKSGCIYIVLSRDADVANEIQSCFQAEIINYVYENLYKNEEMNTDLSFIANALHTGDIEQTLYCSYQYTLSRIEDFRRSVIKNGWLAEPALLNSDEWRALWDSNGLIEKKDF